MVTFTGEESWRERVKDGDDDVDDAAVMMVCVIIDVLVVMSSNNSVRPSDMKIFNMENNANIDQRTDHDAKPNSVSSWMNFF
jgi:hypothetical protein